MGTSSCGFHLKGGLPPFGHLRRGYSCTRTNEVFHGSMDQLQRFRLHFDQRFLDFLWNVKIQNNDGCWALYWLGLVSSFLTWCLDVPTWDLVGPQIRRYPLRIGIVFHQWVWSFGSLCDGESTMPIRDQTQDAFLPSHSLRHQTTARQQVQRNIEPGDFWLSTGRRPNRSLV